MEIYGQLGDTEGVAKTCIVLSEQLWRVARVPEAVETCNHGLAALGDGRSAARVRLVGLLGYFLCVLRQYEEGKSKLNEADQLADELGDRSVIASLCGWRAQLHDELGEPRKALPYMLRAAHLARELGESDFAAGILTRAAGCLLQFGALARGRGSPR